MKPDITKLLGLVRLVEIPGDEKPRLCMGGKAHGRQDKGKGPV